MKLDEHETETQLDHALDTHHAEPAQETVKHIVNEAAHHGEDLHAEAAHLIEAHHAEAAHQGEGHHVEAAHHGEDHGEGHHAPHELPNLITVLYKHFPENSAVKFLHAWETSFFSILIAILISFVAIKASRQRKQVPEGLANFFEAVVEGFEGFVEGIVGHGGRQHVPFLGTIFFYILFMNWCGLVPLGKSATAYWSTTMAIALITMVYVQIAGIRAQGFFNYLKHMAGSPSNVIGIFLIPLMLALNVILELVAVPFSLSLRLFANISSEDRLLLSFAEMGFPVLPLQIFANILALVFSLVQAFVFTLLTTVYIALLSHHDDNHEHEETHGASHEAHAPAAQH